jgi:DNA polymerase III delta subunit
MIYLLAGSDIKNKSSYVGDHFPDRDFVFLYPPISKDLLLNYASTNSLFGDSPIVKLDNILRSGEIEFLAEDLLTLKDSETIFIFLEDKLLAADEKKYKKYAEIVKFEEKAIKQAPKVNVFAIADAFSKRDKINTWILYRDAIERGTEPEAISGMLFWKIKTMLLSNSQNFPRERLLEQSSSIVSLYHRAHRGELDLVIGLEQFILGALS